MSENIIILPVLVHLLAAILLIFFWRNVRVQRVISIVGNVLMLVVAVVLFEKIYSGGIRTMQAGNWRAPFGITFVADLFSSLMILLTSIAGLAVAVFSLASISRVRMRFGYFPIYHFLLMGLNGAFLTGDIFNLYVWFEIIIISSFVLMTLGGEKKQIQGAIKYVTMNVLASIIFLTAIGILYGLAGTLNMADLSEKIRLVENTGLVKIIGALFLVGFGIKSAIFPLYFWLPASYHTPPTAVVAIFGGLLTKVGVYALLRIFTLIFRGEVFPSDIISVIAALTLFTGAVGALINDNIRKVFSYLIVCHIGYMIAGLGMFTQESLAGAVFYLVHDVIIKTNLFLIVGLIIKITGTPLMKMSGGLYDHFPRLSLLAALVFFSLVGTPPLSGFWPKLYLFGAAFDTSNYVVLAGLLIASFLTLVIVARVWAKIFWKNDGAEKSANTESTFNLLKPSYKVLLLGPVVLLTFVSLYIGLGAENIAAVAKRVAMEMITPSAYIEAVLGNQNSLP